MKILIYSKLEFNRFMSSNNINDDNVETKDMMIVSINSLDSMFSYFKRQHSNVMIMPVCFCIPSTF